MKLKYVQVAAVGEIHLAAWNVYYPNYAADLTCCGRTHKPGDVLPHGPVTCRKCADSLWAAFQRDELEFDQLAAALR